MFAKRQDRSTHHTVGALKPYFSGSLLMTRYSVSMWSSFAVNRTARKLRLRIPSSLRPPVAGYLKLRTNQTVIHEKSVLVIRRPESIVSSATCHRINK